VKYTPLPKVGFSAAKKQEFREKTAISEKCRPKHIFGRFFRNFCHGDLDSRKKTSDFSRFCSKNKKNQAKIAAGEVGENFVSPM
tara:strand:- start:759 stop:1010 length:252 start_codon:yes stop_codon:yes gene_type:complete